MRTLARELHWDELSRALRSVEDYRPYAQVSLPRLEVEGHEDYPYHVEDEAYVVLIDPHMVDCPKGPLTCEAALACS